MKEHYEIHLKQGDYLAAAAVARRLGLSKEKQRELNSLAGKEAWKKKTGWFNPERRASSQIKATVISAEVNTGTNWYTDGSANIRVKENPGEEWRLGKSGPSGYPKGKKIGIFWNKEGINKRSDVSPGPGWVKGKYLTEEQKNRRSQIGIQVSNRRWKKNSVS